MRGSSGSQLWKPGMGIRFSPKPTRQAALYPPLDLSRSLQSAGDDSLGVKDTGKVPIEPSRKRSASGVVITTAPAAPKVDSQGIDDTKSNISAPPEEPSADDLVKVAEVGDSPAMSPPMTQLAFNVSPELFQAARESPPESPESFWSYTMYRGPSADGVEQRVKVHYCMSKYTAEYICQKHFLGPEVLGFDLEWSANATTSDGPRKNVSLIQLATPSRIALIHLAVFKSNDLEMPTFRKIMEDTNTTKVGVAIKGDCSRLKTHLGITATGIFELSHLYKLTKHSEDGRLHLINRRLISLATQAEDVLRLPLFKGASVRSSDWAKILDATQVKYAAADAYAGLQLYHLLEEKRKSLDPCPPRPHFAETGLPIRVAVQVPSDDEDDEDDDVFEDAVTEIIEIADDSDDASGEQNIEADAAPAANRTLTAGTSNAVPKTLAGYLASLDPRVSAAHEKASQHQLAARDLKEDGRKRQRVGHAALRAYFLWHDNADLDAQALAGLLRTPPLSLSTVVSYLVGAVQAESLPYERERLQDVLKLLPPNAADWPKYRPLFEACRDSL